jgi:hypothetical protein
MDEPLTPFFNVNNQVIEDFPTTFQELLHMDTHVVNEVLMSLGQVTSGNVREKRLRLQQHIGLTEAKLSG